MLEAGFSVWCSPVPDMTGNSHLTICTGAAITYSRRNSIFHSTSFSESTDDAEHCIHLLITDAISVMEDCRTMYLV